ncbi:bifunctional RecB family nuclease/DEAD/DEAH box helicase [Anoxybacillus flavithermus]|nr:DEAD/DEAH box helicase [Anoxybacillus flavithermus]
MINVSPSKIASYFYHECERNFYFHSLSKDLRRNLDVPQELFEQQSINSTVLKGGIDWEETVISKYLDGQVKLGNQSNSASLSQCYLDVEEVVAELKQPSKRYIYQPSIVVPSRFYEKYGIQSKKIRFTVCRPDLIECIFTEEGLQFRIIDIKSSEVLKISHKIQTALYALILASFLEEHGIDGRVDLKETGIWMYGSEIPQYTNIENLLPHLEHFLAVQLQEIVEKSFDDLFWHLDYRCEWCNFYDYCVEKAKAESHVSLIPYLSSHASKFIREQNLPQTIEEFSEFIQSGENKQLLLQSAGLKKRVMRLETQLKAIMNEEVIPYNSFATDMPKGENIRIILTAQRDQVSGKIFAASIYRYGGKDIFEKGIESSHFIATTMEECEIIGKQFVDALYDMLRKIHDYNANKEWNLQKSVQAYVTDNYEWENILLILNDLLLSEQYKEKAVHLLFYFHSDLLSSANEHPEDMIPFPIVVLTTVVSRLFALPAHIAYRLEDLSAYIASHSDSPFLFKAKDYFSFKLTNVMKADLLHQIWENGEVEKIEWVKSELNRRLWLANSVINGIRALAKDKSGNSLLVAWPEKFHFPSMDEYKHPLVSKLAFMTRYETLLNYLEIRQQRALPLEERLENGTTLYLTYLGSYRFRLNNVQVAQEIDEKASWILTEKSYEGELTQNTFYDYKYRNVWYEPKNANLYFTKIEEINRNGQNVELKLDISRLHRFELVEGNDYLLSLRYTDGISSRVLKTLKKLDDESHRILGLLNQPTNYSKKFKKKWDVNEVKAMLRSSGLTRSQRKAFARFLNHTLTLVWGPPGTGKTHFIASALLLLMRIYEKMGRKLNILISGFTHAAIENCLQKVREMNKEGNINLAKLGTIQTEKAKGIDEVLDNDLEQWLASDQHSILGATLYSIQRVYDKRKIEEDFDVVVLDEASQVRVADSLLALSHVKNVGRLLIVGDHFQLPPIIKGKYKVSEGEPFIFESIFRLLFEEDKEKQFTCQLTDNFRMNEVLCRYPAKMIYGPQYTAFDKKIATQTLKLNNESTIDEWIQTIIDPNYPLTVCVYDGIRGTQENEREAQWVAKITKVLRERLLDDNGELYEDNTCGDKKFWNKGVFIISPHHAQIRAIRRSLENEGLRPEFFVGTVDKMQGQEADVAIISYGVSDPELAIMEGEFIYSLNRLNVSLTRAKKKTIIFLSRQLMSPALQVISNDEYNEGVNLMINLEKYSMENGEEVTFEIDGGTLNVYRVGE